MYITTRQKRRVMLTTGFLLGIGVFVILLSVLIINVLNLFDSSVNPTNVILSNVSPTSVTITWRTSQRADGLVRVFREDQEVGEFIDARGASSFFTHYVEISNLEPNTTYTFELISQQQKYSNEVDVDFVFTTAPVLAYTPSPNFVRGRVDGVNHSDVLIFLISDEENSIPLSTYVSNTGEWMLDISRLRSADLNSFLGVDGTSDKRVKLLFYSNVGSKILVGNNNILFGEDGFLGSVNLDDNVDIFANIFQPDGASGLVMGETDIVDADEDDEEGVRFEQEEERVDEEENENENREIKWEPLVLEDK